MNSQNKGKFNHIKKVKNKSKCLKEAPLEQAVT